MIKRIIEVTLLLLFLFQESYSQTQYSPYSIFGIGILSENGINANRALGGTGIALESKNYLNNINPASYSGIDSLSFIFDVGLSSGYTKYKTQNDATNKFNGNIESLAIGFRVKNWWAASIGLVPLSTVDYTINMPDQVEGEITSYTKTFEGEGGVNQFYFGNSFKLIKGLSVGFNASYYFGSITQTEKGDLAMINDYTMQQTNSVKSFYLDYGLQYKYQRNDWSYGLGLTFGNQKKLNSSGTILFKQEADTISTELESNDILFTIPMRIGIGLALCKENVFKTGFDYEKSYWSKVEFSNTSLQTRNSERYSFGLEYSPKTSIKDRGLKNIVYRAGAYYNKSYLQINGEPINSRAITFGFGFPIKYDHSAINLSFEYGINGTTANSLIQEEYWKMNLHLNLHDKWFHRSRFK